MKALAQTWKEVLFNPAVSFARMKTSGGFAAPFLFNLTMVVIYAFFTTIYQLLLTGVLGRDRRIDAQWLRFLFGS